MTERIIPCDGCGRDFSEAYLSDVIGAGGVILHDRNGFCITCAPHRPARGPRSTYSPEKELAKRNAELRASLAERDAKIREFVRRLPVEMFATTNAHYWGKDLQERAEGLENVKRLLRELGLTTED